MSARYFRHVRDNEKIPKKNITTYYLTLDGHEPSNESLGKFKKLENINGHCISYPNEITNWLMKCLRMTTETPFLRESIIQYKNLLEKMTGNQTDIKQRLDIKDIIGKNSENMNSTKMLIDNFRHVKWHAVRNFWDDLSKELESNGYEIISKPTDQNITDITHYETYRKGQKNKQDCGIYFNFINGIKFCVWNESQEYLYWGLEKKEKIDDLLKTQIQEIVESSPEFQENEIYHFWNEFFDNDKDKIWLTNFNHQATFDLINSENKDKAIFNIVEKIKMFEKRIKKSR